jgi:4-aminobutyrate aminotransferase-like enzyme
VGLFDFPARLGPRHPARPAAPLAVSPRVAAGPGLGLFIGIEMVRDRATREPDPQRAAAVRRRAFEHGVVVAIAGRHENVVKISPPLYIPDDQAAAAVDVVVQSIGALG